MTLAETKGRQERQSETKEGPEVLSIGCCDPNAPPADPEVCLRFNLILTYRERPQDTLALWCPADISERVFVSGVLHLAGAAAPRLLKISACMTEATEAGKAMELSEEELAELLPWYLDNRDGKYYFTNEDEDGRRWLAFRDGHCLALGFPG